MRSDSKTSRSLHRTLLGAALTAACMALGMAQAAAVPAASGAAAVASSGVEQRVREELRMVMAELVESGAFGNQDPQQIALAVDTPAQRVSDLGLLVDSAHGDRAGLPVLAVTPGGTAERMGLRAGDVLVALNGISLASDSSAATLRQTVESLPNDSPLAFRVTRDGRTETVSGKLSSVYVPAMHLVIGNAAQVASTAAPPVARAAATDPESQGCGRISQFDVAPRQQQLHAAVIISIDGVAPGPRGANSFRVSAGRHVLQVGERIESRYISFPDTMRNYRIDPYKTLDVDVAPNTTVMIAARLIPEKRSEWQNGAYWEPLAWKEIAEPCR